MKIITNSYDRDLWSLKVRFWVVAALLLVAAVACATLIRTRRIQEKTYAELVRAQTGRDKLKKAAINRNQALIALKAQLGSGRDKSSPESRIYGKLDDISIHLKADDVTVTAIERKNDEVSLPYTLKFKNHDYSSFLNAISYLQESVFPLSSVSSIAIAQADDAGKGGVIFTINGKILTNEKSKP